MKGVILAGGLGTRMLPLTKVTNKHLLPVYKKPMIYYPLESLVDAGIKDILLITGPEHAGDFLKLLGSGKEFGVKLTYEIQDKPGGIAHALALAKDFVDNEKFVAVLGDNILLESIKDCVKEFDKGKQEARVLLAEVNSDEAKKMGVATMQGDKVVEIIEKPKEPKTNFAVVGVYMYTPHVFEVIKNNKPSARGELEITDVNNYYVKKGTLKASKLHTEWTDAGSFDAMYKATVLMRKFEEENRDRLNK